MAATILIVEDESDLSAIVADYVTAAGYQAEVLADGREALAAVRRTQPDLIVLDIMLPGLDGVALCKAAREFFDTPIIMVTAKVQEIDRLLGLEVGADDYICASPSARVNWSHASRPFLAAAGSHADGIQPVHRHGKTPRCHLFADPAAGSGLP